MSSYYWRPDRQGRRRDRHAEVSPAWGCCAQSWFLCSPASEEEKFYEKAPAAGILTDRIWRVLAAAAVIQLSCKYAKYKSQEIITCSMTSSMRTPLRYHDSLGNGFPPLVSQINFNSPPSCTGSLSLSNSVPSGDKMTGGLGGAARQRKNKLKRFNASFLNCLCPNV